VSYVNFAKYVPILGVSAETWTGVKKLFQTVHSVWNEYATRISTSDLNTLVARAFVQRPPRFPKNKVCKIRYISQVESKPPTFLVSVNNRSNANFAFKKWLDNTIRMSFWFVWVPLRIKWKDDKAENPFADRKRNNYGSGSS
jgi:GTP-binding protein